MKRIAIISFLSLSLFGKSKAADGDSIWSANFIHDIYLNFTQVGFYDSLINTHVTDTYMKCDLIFDGRSLPTIGAKFKGNSSFNNSSVKKSMKLDLNNYVAGQDYDGIKKLNLNNGFKDPSFLREKIALDFMVAHGVTAPRCTFARVYLNNVYWGLYALVEEIDSKFLKQHYPDDNGNLYKGDPTGDLKWYGSNAANYYVHYELSSSSTVIDWSDLIHFLDLGNNTAPGGYFDSLETVLDSWSFLNYLAAQNIFSNLDSYAGSGHNYYAYDDSTYFRFRWIAWDVNEAFGNFNMSMSLTQIENLNYDFLSTPTNRPIAMKMFADPTYHSMYITSFCNMMPYFNNANLDPIIDSLANAIRTDVYADPNKFFTNQQFEDNLTMNIGNTAGLKPFITARNASLTSQLSAYGCWLGVSNNSTVPSTLFAFPNPAQTSTTIQLPTSWKSSECSLNILDATGRQINAAILGTPSENKLEIGLSDLSDGIYIVSISNSVDETLHLRLVVQH